MCTSMLDYNYNVFFKSKEWCAQKLAKLRERGGEGLFLVRRNMGQPPYVIQARPAPEAYEGL